MLVALLGALSLFASPPVAAQPDPDLLTGLTFSNGTLSPSFGGPGQYHVSVPPGVCSVTVTLTWTNNQITGIAGQARDFTYGRDTTAPSWQGTESGTGKTLRLLRAPTGVTPFCGNGSTMLTLTIGGVTSENYRILLQHIPPPLPPSVSLSASPSMVTEGSSVTITAQLSEALSSNVTIPLTLTDNSAEPADHGTLADITITSGQTSGTSTVTTNQDTDTDDETFTVALDTTNLPSSVRAGSPSSVRVTIRDDDGGTTPSVSLSASPSTVTEGSSVTVAARLSEALSSNVTIPLTLTDNSAEPADHGTLADITITSGQTSGTSTVTTNQDTDTDDETFTVALDTTNLPSSVRAGSPSSVRVTIRDDDGGTTPDDPIIRQPPPDTDGTPSPSLSGDASLSALEIEEVSLDFDPDRDTYRVNAYGISSLTLTPTANHEDAEITVTVNGETVEKEGTSYPVTLDGEGETTITIEVTAEDGTTRTYTLTVMFCPGEERKILEMFYHRTQGDMGWVESGGWNTEDDLDNWHGVRTRDGMVTVISLPGNNLSGDIPSALLCFGGLEKLSELALWDNDDLSGEVPDGLALPVERAVLRAVAGALELNTEWFEDYGEPFNFKGWHEGVTMDEDGRVTDLDFSDTEEIEGTIPAVLLEQLKRLETLYVNCTISVGGDAPAGVNVKEVCEEPEPEEPEEGTASSGGGGCALSTGSGDAPVFGLFLMVLLVFAALGRKRAR